MRKNPTKKQLPNLDRNLERLSQKSLAAAGSRFGIYEYLASVLKTYRNWKSDGVLRLRMKQVRKLRPISAREGSHPFIQILAATSSLSAKARSKWATFLQKAEKEKIAPEELRSFARQLRDKDEARPQNRSKQRDDWF
jgi:hypothetical protein